jgi:excisionase family DNA binding protein
VSRGTVYALIRRGALRKLKVAGRTRLQRSELERFLATLAEVSGETKTKKIANGSSHDSDRG